MSDQWRILIVEDEDELSQNIANSLRKDGYQVEGVTSSAAIRVLWSEEYDVVISDLKTPGAEGFDLLQWVRGYRPRVRMIMLGSPEMRAQALENGAVGFVTAPVDLHELKEELRRLLQQTGFSASLDSFDLLDVIQIVTMSRKNIALLINTGLEERGMLGFQNGDLIWAEYGLLRGEEAFFALAAHKNGTVIHQAWNAEVRSNVTQPLSRLIFQALQYRAKYANVIQPTGEQIAVSPSTSMSSVLDQDDDDAPFLVFEEDHPLQGSSIQAEPEAGAFKPQADTHQPQLQAGEMSEIPDYEKLVRESKEWWEETGRIASVSKKTVELAPDKLSAKLPPLTEEESNPLIEEAPAPPLPSWVTDQPTVSNLPVIKPQLPTYPAGSEDERQQPGSAEKRGEHTEGSPYISASPNQPLTTDPISYPLGSIESDAWNRSDTQRTHSGPLSSLHVHPPVTGSLANESRLDSGKLLARRLDQGRLQSGRSGQLSGGHDDGGHSRSGRQESGQYPVGRINQASPIDRSDSGVLPIKRLDTSKAPPKRTERTEGSTVPAPERKESGSGSRWGSTQRLPAQPGPQFDWETPPPTATWEQRDFDVPMPEMPTTQMEPVVNVSASVPAIPIQTEKNASGPVEKLPAKWNYPELVGALQSLGYAVPGFIATALALMDGQPIAQVAVGDLDISSTCKQFSLLLQGSLQVLDESQWGSHKQQILVSTERTIFLHPVGDDRRVFLILMTTAKAKMADSLDALESIDGALRAAL